MPRGRLTLDVTAEGTGMSPVALIGSLGGSGTFTLESGTTGAARSGGIRCRDPRGRSGPADRREQGRDRMDAALAGGGLAYRARRGHDHDQCRAGATEQHLVRAQGADLA